MSMLSLKLYYGCKVNNDRQIVIFTKSIIIIKLSESKVNNEIMLVNVLNSKVFVCPDLCKAFWLIAKFLSVRTLVSVLDIELLAGAKYCFSSVMSHIS